MKQIQTKAPSKPRRGSALMLCMPLVIGLSLVAASLFNMTSTSSRIAYQSMQKAQSDALAETGLNAIYCQMANVPSGSTIINGAPISSTSLSGKVGSVSSSDGSFTAKILTQSSAMVNGQLTYSYTIQGTGTAPNGTTSIANSAFTMTQNGMGGFNLGNAAIKANGNVTIAGGGVTNDPSGLHGASVLANGSITMNGSGAYIDGTGSAYQPSPSLTTSDAFAVSPLTALMPFPSAATTTNWRSTWLAQAQEPTPTYPAGNSINGDLSIKGNSTLTAPEYVSGNLSVNGKAALTINPDPKANTPCVLFVHGTITVNGGANVANNGVLIVSDGTQTYNGNTNVYSAVNMVNCGLLSFSNDSAQAIKINGGAGVSKVGVVYAINGGVTLSGGAVFQGSIISGGASAAVSVAGGGAVRYEGGWDSQFAALATSYTASNLSHWVRLK